MRKLEIDTQSTQWLPRVVVVLVFLLSGILLTAYQQKDDWAAQNQFSEQKMKKQMVQTTKDTKTEAGLKMALQRLINGGEDFGLEQLDAIYHRNMQIVMIDHQGQKMEHNKAEFMQFVAQNFEKVNQGNNRWAQFHLVQVSGDQGHIVLTRRNELTGVPNELQLSIDFVHEDGRWQITREVIFSRPLNG